MLCGAGGDVGWTRVTLLSRAERASVASAALRNCGAGAILVETCCAGIEALLAEVLSCVVNRSASGFNSAALLYTLFYAWLFPLKAVFAKDTAHRIKRSRWTLNRTPERIILVMTSGESQRTLK
jgi:hypothetical protein